MHSIRVTAYWGGHDELNEIYLIGPYGTTEARDTDMDRIAGLPGNHGDATFQPSRLDPAGADHHATPEQVAPAWLFRQVVHALNGYPTICPDCGSDPARAAYPECACGVESAAFTAELAAGDSSNV